MPSLSNISLPREHEPTVKSPDSLVPVKPKLLGRFYGPNVLLWCINEAWKANQSPLSPDSSPEGTMSAEDEHRCFVNKLAQLCDAKPRGNTVTAFVVLQLPDRIRYRFASNQRTLKELLSTRSFITNLLQTLGRSSRLEVDQQIPHILHMSLSFIRPRIEKYAKNLEKYAAVCSKLCNVKFVEESDLANELEVLRQLSQFSYFPELDSSTFSRKCEDLIYAIDRLYQSDLHEDIRMNTKEGKYNESEPWREFRHNAGRLLSYLHAVRFLVVTRKRQPDLFQNFDVEFVASSEPDSCPLRSMSKVQTDEIVKRMTSDSELLGRYRAIAQELEKFGVHEHVRDIARGKNFYPIVHAEMLLLDSLEKDGGTDPSRFYNNSKYIGCSKPTCRLCHYYFFFHRSGVEVRPSHRNLYLAWRMPDVFEFQGPKAEEYRDQIMRDVIERIRQDTVRTMAEKVPERKAHDSNTEPTFPIQNILQFADDIDEDELARQTADLDISSVYNEDGSDHLG